MLYVIPVSVGAVTVIVPVATAHVGCAVTLAVGTEGVNGWGLTVTLVLAETQPTLFFAVTLYVPAVTPVKIPIVFE